MNFWQRVIGIVLGIFALLGLKWYFDPDIEEEDEIMQAKEKLHDVQLETLKELNKLEEDKLNDK